MRFDGTTDIITRDGGSVVIEGDPGSEGLSKTADGGTTYYDKTGTISSRPAIAGTKMVSALVL